MSKNRNRNRNRGKDDIKNVLPQDPIIGNPQPPVSKFNLVTGTYNELFDTISGTPWFKNASLARTSALEYGYDGGAIEYFVHPPTLFHYQYGTMIQVSYMTAPGVVTGGLIFPDSNVTFVV